MAIRDLLWACPLCGAVDALAPADKAERCRSCGARFRRGQRSLIEVTRPEGGREVRSAAEWAGQLPAEPPGPERETPGTPGARGAPGGEGAGESGAGDGPALWRKTRVLVRFALGDEAIRRGGAFLGFRERLGPERPGTLALTTHALELTLDDGEERRWALDELSALQASSTSIQIRPRGQPIVSFAFPESSARLWDESIAGAVRLRWRALGRGEIAEFQPRIVAAPASPGAAGTRGATSPPGTRP